MAAPHILAQCGRLVAAGSFLIGVSAIQPLVASAAGAESTPTPRFAIIDVQRVLRESEAVKGLNREIEKLRTAYQAELRDKEQGLRSADQELARQRTVLSAEVFAQKRQELGRRVATVQREVQDRKRALDRSFSKGLSQVQAELANVAKALAAERELDLIFSKATVVIVKPEFELTAEVSKRLNERLPAVTIEIPPQ